MLRTTGRAAEPVQAELVRALTVLDLELLDDTKGVKPPPIKRLGERHHSLARCLAQGMKDWQAAHTCGYDISRVSILKGDPTFQELIAHYRAEVDALFVDSMELAANVTRQAAILTAERLEEQGDKISLKELRETFVAFGDRSGMGPSSKQEVNVNVNLADRLAEARKRVAARTIDLTAEASE